MMFLDCPAYLDQDGAARCGLPAEVSRWFTMGSTDGPLESAVIRCAASSKPSASASLTLKGLLPGRDDRVPAAWPQRDADLHRYGGAGQDRGRQRQR